MAAGVGRGDFGCAGGAEGALAGEAPFLEEVLAFVGRFAEGEVCFLFSMGSKGEGGKGRTADGNFFSRLDVFCGGYANL